MKHILETNSRHNPGNALLLSFFFHGRGSDLQKTAEGFYRSVIYQMLSQAPNACSDLMRSYTENCQQRGNPSKGWEWHLQELRRFFDLSIYKQLEVQPIRIFVDALDECGSDMASMLLKDFEAIISHSSTSSTSSALGICFTCRHYPIIEYHGPEICVEEENDHNHDIETYVDQRLQNVDQELRDIILQKASNTFLWVKLVIDRVIKLRLERKSRPVIRRAVEDLPVTLKELYRKILSDVRDPSDRKELLDLVRWVLFAVRPLTLEEFNIATAIDPALDSPYKSLQQYRDEELLLENLDDMEARVKSRSRGLAEVRLRETIDRSSMTSLLTDERVTTDDLPSTDSPTSTDCSVSMDGSENTDSSENTDGSESNLIVQFIHQSVVDFLIEDGLKILHGDRWQPDPWVAGIAHYQLSRTCVRYLNLTELHDFDHQAKEELRVSTFGSIKGIMLKSPRFKGSMFLEYATQHWAEHAKSSLDSGISQEDLLKYFDWPKNELACRCAHYYQFYGGKYWATMVTSSSILQFAATWDLADVVSAITKNSNFSVDDIEVVDINGSTPLMLAAMHGNKRIMEILLAANNTVAFSRDYCGQTPLHHACMRGMVAAVELLLDIEGADPDSRDQEQRTPLHYAVFGADKEIVRILLETGRVDPDSRDHEQKTSLHYAVFGPDKEIVRILLETGKVDPDSRDQEQKTPLHYAVLEAREDMVRMLLEIGKVDPNSRDHEQKPFTTPY
ncbi:MAG: hypothetical protein Q9225_001286 [Loekoesia sp. 1 TL-2023]